MHDEHGLFSCRTVASTSALRVGFQYVTAHRFARSARKRSKRVSLFAATTVIFVASLLTGVLSAGVGATNVTVDWSAPIAVDTAYPYGASPNANTSSGMTELTCTATSSNPLCIGIGGSGIFASNDASGGTSSDWTVTPTVDISHEAMAYSLETATCATDGPTSFCIAGGSDPNTGDGIVLSSPGPSGAASSWATDELVSGGVVRDISCTPQGNLCAAIEDVNGYTSSATSYVIATNDPSSSDPTWFSSEVDPEGTLVGIACPSSMMCVAVDSTGLMYYSQNLGTSNYPSWTGPADVDLTGGGFGGIACASATLCVAYDVDGYVYAMNPNVGGVVESSAQRLESSSDVLDAISCPSSAQCFVSSSMGDVYAIEPETPGTTAPQSTTVDVDATGDLTGISCSSASLCAATNETGEVFLSADPGATWSSYELDENVTPTLSASCASGNFCAVGSSDGAVFTSINANDAPATFTPALVPSTGDTPFYTNSLSCPSTSLCVAVDGEGRVFTSANPTAANSTWTSATIDEGQFLDAVSCPTTSLCVALDSAGDVLTTTNPTGGASAWAKSAQVDHSLSGFEAVTCPSSTFCAAIDEAGLVFISTDPTGGASTWSAGTAIDSSTNELMDISCASSSLCVAIDGVGNALVSTDPTTNSWTSVVIDTEGYELSGVSCPSSAFCAAVDYSGDLFTSNNPSGGTEAWTTTGIDTSLNSGGLAGISCSSASFCVAVDGDGNALSSVDPPGGTAAWSSSAIDTGVVLTNVACPSTQLCVATDARGDVMTGALGLIQQTISFTTSAPTDARVGEDTYSPQASATSELPVTIKVDSSSSAICSIAKGVVHFKTVGTCVIDANQEGSVDYAAASQVQQRVAVAPAPTVSTKSQRLVDDNDIISFKITCKFAHCSGSARIEEKITVKVKKATKTHPKTKTIVLAEQKFSMKENSSRVISLIVTAAGNTRFANATAHPAKVQLDFDVAGVLTPKPVTVT